MYRLSMVLQNSNFTWHFYDICKVVKHTFRMIYWSSHEIKIKYSWEGSSFIFYIASIHAQTKFRKRECIPFKIPILEIREFLVTTDRLRATFFDISVGLFCVCGTDWDGLSTSLITIKVALLCIYGDTFWPWALKSDYMNLEIDKLLRTFMKLLYCKYF